MHGKSTSKPTTQKTSMEHTADWYSTETIAKQLLDPVVSEVERAEYQGLVFFPTRVLVIVQVVWIGILINAKNFWMRRRLWVNGRRWKFTLWLFRQLEGIPMIIGQKRSRKNSSLISNAVLRSISMVVRRKHYRCLSITIGG